MLKPKRYKYRSRGTLLDVELLKKRAPLWCEASLEVKMLEALHVRTTFGTWDDETVRDVVAQSASSSLKARKHLMFRALWTLRC